jgi:hypothetical protein
MKKLLLLSFLTLITRLIYCQNTTWHTYEIDSLMRIDMPGDIMEMDTTFKNYHIYQIESTIDNTTYMAQKLLSENLYIDVNLSRLPYDSVSLEKYYESYIKGIIKTAPAIFNKKQSVSIDGFSGYQIEFVDSLNKLVIVDRFFLLNKHLYNLMLMNFQGFDTTDIGMFFNSIKLHNKESISQFRGQPQSYRIGYLIGKNLLIILIVAGVMIWIIKRKKK